MEKYYSYDTNTLLKDPFHMHEMDNVVISGAVLDELDNQKDRESSISYYARRARKELEKREKKDGFVIDLDASMHPLIPENWAIKNDHIILSTCLRFDAVFVTNDMLPLMKGRHLNLDVMNIIGISDTLAYSGMFTLEVDNSEYCNNVLNEIFTNGTAKDLELIENQYLIIDGVDEPYEDRIFKSKDGFLVPIQLPHHKVVYPKNDEQACALDLLMDRSIPVKIITGTHGTGKTFLATKVALEEVLGDPDSPYHEIMIVRNPIGSGEEIGFVTGDKNDKTKDFFKPIEQHINVDIAYLESQGILKKNIPFYMKGLSIPDTFIISDEAEDLNKKLVKLIGGRLDMNSCIAFTGDYQQAENKFATDNGLLYAIEHLKGDPLVGIIQLSEDVRSEASKVFASL